MNNGRKIRENDDDDKEKEEEVVQEEEEEGVEEEPEKMGCKIMKKGMSGINKFQGYLDK